MAKTKNKPQISLQNATMKTLVKKYFTIDYIKKLIFDPNYITPVCWLLLIAEIFLNIIIIQNVNYTEIDWKAYMQEVEGFLNGTLDYQELKGDTGPCVYPAGFLYIYSIFYYVTEFGRNVRVAQYIFLGFYILQTYFTYEIYKKTCKIPAYALILSAITSYRIHSIYVLRLFNDPIAVLLFYASLNAMLSNKWKTASVLFSLAVSVKMNILLYAPCLLIAYLTNLSYKDTFFNLVICGAIQLLLGLPFLYKNPYAYVKASFDLGRVFEHKWTVNYRFLEREIFENAIFHVSLLGLHVLLLLLFLPHIKRYLKSYATLRNAIVEMQTQSVASEKERKKELAKKKLREVPKDEPLSKEQQEFLDSFEKQMTKGGAKQRNMQTKKKAPPQVADKQEEKYEINFNKISQLLVLPFFVTNLIGIACSRSLHYQFYSWYFHSLLYLVHCTPFKKTTIFLILGVIEFCWNVYPSTDISSASLHISHVVLISGIYKTMKS